MSEPKEKTHLKRRLLILSDLWGKEKADWVEYYQQALQHDFNIHFYDCCELADVDKSGYTQDALHKQFLNDGIEKAVEKLLTFETDKVTILAFSIGGTIAWKFAHASQKVSALYCVSSTRLRYETVKPTAKIQLWYGEYDHFRPSKDWFDQIDVDYDILKGEDHELYTKPVFAVKAIAQILKPI